MTIAERNLLVRKSKVFSRKSDIRGARFLILKIFPTKFLLLQRIRGFEKYLIKLGKFWPTKFAPYISRKPLDFYTNSNRKCDVPESLNLIFEFFKLYFHFHLRF